MFKNIKQHDTFNELTHQQQLVYVFRRVFCLGSILLEHPEWLPLVKADIYHTAVRNNDLLKDAAAWKMGKELLKPQTIRGIYSANVMNTEWEEEKKDASFNSPSSSRSSSTFNSPLSSRSPSSFNSPHSGSGRGSPASFKTNKNPSFVSGRSTNNSSFMTAKSLANLSEMTTFGGSDNSNNSRRRPNMQQQRRPNMQQQQRPHIPDIPYDMACSLNERKITVSKAGELYADYVRQVKIFGKTPLPFLQWLNNMLN